MTGAVLPGASMTGEEHLASINHTIVLVHGVQRNLISSSKGVIVESQFSYYSLRTGLIPSTTSVCTYLDLHKPAHPPTATRGMAGAKGFCSRHGPAPLCTKPHHVPPVCLCMWDIRFKIRFNSAAGPGAAAIDACIFAALASGHRRIQFKRACPAVWWLMRCAQGWNPHSSLHRLPLFEAAECRG